MTEFNVTLPFFYSPISYTIIVLILATPLLRTIVRALEALPG